MEKAQIFLGKTAMKEASGEISPEIVRLWDEDFYCIRNFDRMPPFFMSIVSNSDHWMYISSRGGLTAGRINPDNALFPYYTDDKIHDSSENTGSRTLVLCAGKEDRHYLWEPFSSTYKGVYSLSRNLYKNIPGNKIIFEEINHDLNLSFRYAWMNSDKYGWVRKSEIINNSEENQHVQVLDGLLNMLPYGILRQTQANFSTLMDAYKKSELVKESGLALLRMSSIPVDRAEPSEALRATSVFTLGLKNPAILLSSSQIDDFREGKTLMEETSKRGIRCDFLLNFKLDLTKGKNAEWIIVAETRQDASDIRSLIKELKNPEKVYRDILEDVERGSENLREIVSKGDGLQECADRLVSGRHFSNVLFNIMRGGFFSEAYSIDVSDFHLHMLQWNTEQAKKHEGWIKSLGEKTDYQVLLQKAKESGDENLQRLVLEYLPISFSRRHGDPSRPWNIFSINLKNQDGSPALYYQGNWRDIFQNWEALAMSYPLFVKSFITKFLNASTADGYNPYRISREGIDWEVHDPSDPWSNIGYWGDHQIIYLLKLLELSEKFFPGELKKWFNDEIFVYANVPYRIKAFEQVLKNPQDSIIFDEELHAKLLEKAKSLGADGKLLCLDNGNLYRVNLVEKLFASILSKLSNFIPGGGIWMNTQRPDWNDANNALTGFGISMVSLYHLRRHLEFLLKLFATEKNTEYAVSAEMNDFLKEINTCFVNFSKHLGGGIDDSRRKEITYQLGTAGSLFREKVYKGLSSRKSPLKNSEILDFLKLSLEFIDDTITSNKRSDGLFHSYNLLSVKEDKIVIRNLYEMLEGQVSCLGSGYLSPEKSLDLLDALRKSKMYRKDQNSYTLYPDRELPLFLEKNNIPEARLRNTPALKKLLDKNITEIVQKDIDGNIHFNAGFNNASVLKSALISIKSKSGLNDKEEQEILDLYEEVFDHQTFTGRSGTFYKYEGLGCIYWHMVSKLLLSTGEVIQKAISGGAKESTIKKLKEHYLEINKGIGLHKNPKDYGAFTTDPYSHTPSMMGVQQPGMTGQVKEDILSRWIELGLWIDEGKVRIQPALLRKDEFINPAEKGKGLPSLKFSFCGTAFEYLLTEKDEVIIQYKNGKTESSSGLEIGSEDLRNIAARNKIISGVQVGISAKHFDRV
ncbi:MAG: hypothetical protein H6539_01605 [Bacteroidales bacterium]|nr:hypothetical protein [Bacteroidales bacterium]